MHHEVLLKIWRLFIQGKKILHVLKSIVGGEKKERHGVKESYRKTECKHLVRASPCLFVGALEKLPQPQVLLLSIHPLHAYIQTFAQLMETWKGRHLVVRQACCQFNGTKQCSISY
jgi:hypothetical protein